MMPEQPKAEGLAFFRVMFALLSIGVATFAAAVFVQVAAGHPNNPTCAQVIHAR